MPFRKISRDVKLAAVNLHEQNILSLEQILVDCVGFSESFWRMLELWQIARHWRYSPTPLRHCWPSLTSALCWCELPRPTCHTVTGGQWIQWKSLENACRKYHWNFNMQLISQFGSLISDFHWEFHWILFSTNVNEIHLKYRNVTKHRAITTARPYYVLTSGWMTYGQHHHVQALPPW